MRWLRRRRVYDAEIRSGAEMLSCLPISQPPLQFPHRISPCTPPTPEARRKHKRNASLPQCKYISKNTPSRKSARYFNYYVHSILRPGSEQSSSLRRLIGSEPSPGRSERHCRATLLIRLGARTNGTAFIVSGQCDIPNAALYSQQPLPIDLSTRAMKLTERFCIPSPAVRTLPSQYGTTQPRAVLLPRTRAKL